MSGTLDFSVLLPVYRGDDALFFEEAIGSIAAGTVAPTEVLICQDGDLPPALARAVDAAVTALGARVIVNPGLRGLHYNLNHALAFVRTPWIARCDADDINLPNRFEAQTDFLAKHPDVGVLGGDLIEFWPDGRSRPKRMPRGHEAIVAWAQWRSPVNHNTVFIRTAELVACGGYPNLALKEDYGLWLRLMGRGVRFANMELALVRARLGEGFYGRRAGARNLASEWEICRIKREVPALRGPLAGAAFLARTLALSAAPLTRLIYEAGLRR